MTIKNPMEISPFAAASASANGTLTDGLLVSTTSPVGAGNLPKIAAKGTTSQIPADLQTGVREVYWAESGKVVAVITGIDTDGRPGRWINSYVAGAGWAGWQQETTGPLVVHGTGNLTAVGGTVPGTICGIKYPSVRKVDVHIDCSIEAAPTQTSDFAFLPMDTIRDKLGVASLSWDPATQSRVIVESAADYGAATGTWGRAGLRLGTGGDIRRQYTTDLNTTGSWSAGTTAVFRVGTYLHIDVWGADYT